MKRINNIIGKRFNKLVVIEYTDQRKYRQVVWKCKCDCGTITFLTHGELKNVKSCGCFKIEHCSNLGKTYNSVGREAYKEMRENRERYEKE